VDAIWHITPDGRPARRGGEGFVHASFSAQLTETLRLHHPDPPSVVLLRLDPEALGKRLVVEPSRGGALFPHVYGEIEDRDVLERVPLERGADGHFDLGRVPGA
jgi:uncharacterized protein (DUF952 family)